MKKTELRTAQTHFCWICVVCFSALSFSNNVSGNDDAVFQAGFSFNGKRLTKALEETTKLKFTTTIAGNLRGRGKSLDNTVVDITVENRRIKKVEISTDNIASNEVKAIIARVAEVLIDSPTMDGLTKASEQEILTERDRVKNWIYGPALRAAVAALEATPIEERDDEIRTQIKALFKSVRVTFKVTPQAGEQPVITLVFSPGHMTTGILPSDD